MNTILLTFLVSAAIAFVLGVLLGFFKKLFYVPVDETVEKIRNCLPGANCGGCGYPGCSGFANALTGAGISAIIIVIGVFMIIKANKRLKELNKKADNITNE